MSRKLPLATTLTFALFFTSFSTAPRAVAQTETVLHTFSTAKTNGASPRAGLTLDSAGNLYGTTGKGGSASAGTIYQLTPNGSGGWTFNLLYSFFPKPQYDIDEISAVTFDNSGNMYGTTSLGGNFNDGRLFELSPVAGGGWSETVIHNFQINGTDGYLPLGGVTVDASGNLYGAAYYGGTGTCQFITCGVVYEFSPRGDHWVEEILHDFQNNGTDGNNPNGPLVFDAEGNLHGATVGGGTYGEGTVFELSKAAGGGWTEKVIHSFGATGDLGFPGGLIVNGGNLYGATANGGTISGNVFELIPGSGGTWTEQILYSFPQSITGPPVLPGGLVMDSAGNIFGTGVEGGANDDGAVFELSPQSGGTYSETTLYSFANNPDGALPAGSLVIDSHGNLYGVTQYGGAVNAGTIYKVTP